MLSMNNDIYLHEFYLKDNNEQDICYICGEIESKHAKTKFDKLPYNINFLNSIREELEGDSIQNNNVGNSVIYETSLVDDSYNDYDLTYKEDKKLTTSYIKIESNPKKALTITNLKDKNEENLGIFSSSRGLLDKLTAERNINKSYNSLPIKNNSDITIKENSFNFTENEKECGICLGTIQNKFEIPICLDCFCIDCFKEYLKEKVKSSSTNKIPCPKENCKQLVLKETLKVFLNEEELKKIDKFEKRKTIINTPNSIFCPWPDCESYAIKSINKVKENEILKCVDNNHEFCVLCMEKAEENHKCLKMISMEKWEKNQQDVKKCPKCGFLIQKTEGCNHMKCINSSCEYEFCWICLGKYELDHFNNPTTTCFGLGNIATTSLLARFSILRMLKCISFPILTFLIILILPAFFSFFLVGFVYQQMDVSSIMKGRPLNKCLITIVVVFSVILLGFVYLISCILFVLLLIIIGIPSFISVYIFETLMKKDFKKKIDIDSPEREEILNNPEIQENRNQAFELQRIEKRNNFDKIMNDNISYRIDLLNNQKQTNNMDNNKLEVIIYN